MEQQSTEELLVEFGVHLGFKEPRQALARELEKGGLTGLDLRMVCDHVKDQSTSKAAGARISSVLQDKNRWGPLLADLRKFHEYRNAKQRKTAKRKAEPGRGLREEDKNNRLRDTAAYWGMSEEEMLEFRWRWTIADWHHRGHSDESLEKYMDATQAEIRECVRRFPDGKTFDECLNDHVKGTTNASNPGPD